MKGKKIREEERHKERERRGESIKFKADLFIIPEEGKILKKKKLP
jgi:hypothetical protein